MKELFKKINKPFLSAACMACIGACLTLILMTYDVHDASFFYKSLPSGIDYHTYGGSFGSSSASLIFFLLGLASYLLIPFFFVGSYLIMIRAFTVDTLVGFILCLWSLTTLLHYCDSQHASLCYSGGLLGIASNAVLLFLFDAPIVWLLCFVTLVIGTILWLQMPCIPLSMFIVRCLYFLHMRIPYRKIVNPLNVVYAALYACKKMVGGQHTFREQEKIVFEELAAQVWYQEYSPTLWKTTGEYEKESKEQGVEEIFCQKEQNNSGAHFSIDEQKKEIPYQIPNPADFFHVIQPKQSTHIKNVTHMARILEEKLERFGIQGKVVSITSGPVITLFEYEPHIESKISKIISLEDDLALALEALSMRIIAPIPGKSVVGFEVAYQERREVLLSNLLLSKEFEEFDGKLPLIMGQDTTGNSSIIDLMKAPHILVAGSTGSGKSVALNTMIVSLLCKHTPSTLKFILIDPKRLEFSPYADIPHLMVPLITEVRKAIIALQWVIKIMHERYECMETFNVRNMSEYNDLAAQHNQEQLPFIVIVIDELADLMMSGGKELEELVARIAQMARAAGIHMIVATQRPSVDVITGLIKVNFPSRIAFKVTSKVDSRVILDCVGADKLLGKGDMLYLNASTQLQRLHGSFMSNEQREMIVNYCKEQQRPSYIDMSFMMAQSLQGDDEDNLWQEVIEFLKTVDEVSISLLQRKFRIGYNRAARIVELLEEQGFILRDASGKTRRVIRS